MDSKLKQDMVVDASIGFVASAVSRIPVVSLPLRLATSMLAVITRWILSRPSSHRRIRWLLGQVVQIAVFLQLRRAARHYGLHSGVGGARAYAAALLVLLQTCTWGQSLPTSDALRHSIAAVVRRGGYFLMGLLWPGGHEGSVFPSAAPVGMPVASAVGCGDTVATARSVPHENAEEEDAEMCRGTSEFKAVKHGEKISSRTAEQSSV